MSDANVPQAPATKSTPDSTEAKKQAKLLQMHATLDSLKLALNREFCFIERLPGIAVIPTPDDPELHVFTRGEFIESICADRIVGSINAAREWMKWNQKNKVRNLTYAPGKPQIFNNQLNTWVGSKIKPKRGDLALWFGYLDHIFQSDSTHRDWFTAWLAYQFQFPGTKLHSATVFWSTATGTGKSFFGYLMAELFGTHNFSEINESELHGRFNFWAARKQFVMGEEIKGSNAQKHADFLKSVITRKFVTIDTKNTPHYTLPDCINYFFTSNRENAFFLDDTDRRFFVHRLADKGLDADYVEQTLKPWLTKSGYSAILHWLLHEVDLSKPLKFSGKPFNPFGAAPQSEARKQMVLANRDDAEEWLDELLECPQNVLGDREWTLVTASDLYEVFCETNKRTKVFPKGFSAQLRKRVPALYSDNKVTFSDGRKDKVYALGELGESGKRLTQMSDIVSNYEEQHPRIG